MLPWLLFLIAAVIAAGLIIKIYFMHKSLKMMEKDIAEIICGNDNRQLLVYGNDRYVKSLAASINRELKNLRMEQLRYLNGDNELKTAITNISHDLRTPLTAINGYLELLEGEEKSENIKRYLSYIRNRVEALKELTEELFRYSVIISEESEKTSEKYSSSSNKNDKSDDTGNYNEICINSVLEESLAGMYAAFTERNIVPEINISEIKQYRKLDGNKLARIFENILSNALKYSDGDLSVTLDDNGLMCFSNHAEELTYVQTEKLFYRFFTVSDARKSTGLGLSIARTLVENMNGEIWAEYRKDGESGVLNIMLTFR